MLRIADLNQVPILTILFSVLAVAGVYIFGQITYHLRNILLLGLVGGFLALILNPLVLFLQTWKVKRRGAAVAIVAFVALLAFFGLAVLFGYPLVNGITRFAHALPGYIATAQHGKGPIGHLLARYHVESWVRRITSKLTSLAGIPTILFAFAHSFTAGLVTAIVFLVYTQVENHVLNPIVMSRTVKINPLLVFVSVLVGAEIGSWVAGLFGGFVAVLLAVPIAASVQVLVREYWHHTAPEGERRIADRRKPMH